MDSNRISSKKIKIKKKKCEKSLRDVLILRSAKKKGRKKSEDESSVDDENSPRNLHEALLRSVKKRRNRLRPSTPLSDSVLVDAFGRLPRPPMKMNRSSDLWYFGKRKWNRLDNMTCHLVRCENSCPPVMVAVLNFGMIRLGSSVKFLEDRKCLLFKREKTVFGFHVSPHQVVAIQDILAGIKGAEVLLPSPNSWKENRSSRLDGIRKTLVSKFESRCDVMERSRWTGAVIISSLACISLMCDLRKLWRGLRRGGLSLETVQLLLISWTGSTALYSWVLCQSFVMNSRKCSSVVIERSDRARSARISILSLFHVLIISLTISSLTYTTITNQHRYNDDSFDTHDVSGCNDGLVPLDH